MSSVGEIKFSIIIPVKQINQYVHETVGEILKYWSKKWQLIIVVNDIEPNPWQDNPNIAVVESGRVAPGRKRDIGRVHAEGDYLVFLDDDSYPSPTYFGVVEKVLKDDQFDVLCGPGLTPQSDANWQQASGASFISRLCGGNPARYLASGPSRIVREWPTVNFIIRADLFDSVHGFETDFWPGEDSYICMKLRAVGAKIWYFPELQVYHHRRAGLLQHTKQVGAYGLHRGHLFRRFSPDLPELKYCLPSLLVAALSLSITLILFQSEYTSLGLYVLVFYLFYLLLIVCEVSVRIGIRTALLGIPFYVITHFAYGVRFIHGVLTRNLQSQLR